MGQDGRVRLPVMPPTSPMLAKLARELPPAREGTIYEPKWDGFRAIVYRDGEEIEIESRGEKSFTRYFPELVPVLLSALPARIVVDGEIVVAGPHGLDFHLLQQRIHPAASRVKMLSEQTPASFVAFDLLALGDDDLRRAPFSERRGLLEKTLRKAKAPVHVTPATPDRAVAEGWLDRFVGSGLDGVMVKDPALAYHEGKRVMVKVKHERTVECVVAGYRVHKDGKGAGSLLLGLFDKRGELHHVGVCSAFAATQRVEILDHVRPHELGADEMAEHPWAAWGDEAAHQTLLMPGTPSRWSGARAAEKGVDQAQAADWVALRCDLVAEVRFEHLQGARFRHPARFSRWRPDRTPESCTYGQLVAPTPVELATLLG